MSKYLSVDQQDMIKGLALAVMLVLVQGVYIITSTGVLPTATQMHNIGMDCFNVFLAYILKNFFSGSNGMPLSKEKNITPTATEGGK